MNFAVDDALKRGTIRVLSATKLKIATLLRGKSNIPNIFVCREVYVAYLRDKITLKNKQLIKNTNTSL